MTKIEWTERTWNPIAGCTPVSSGCANCYAERMAGRLVAMKQSKYAGTVEKRAGRWRWTGKINLDERKLSIPLRTRRPTTWFVNSMSDLFHPDVPFEFITRVFDVMCSWRWPSKAAEREGNEENLVDPGHTYQVLTKRPERILPWLEWVAHNWPGDSPFNVHDGIPRHVWLGTSVEDQRTADERIPHLLRVPASVRFLSCEPLLEHIDLSLDIGRAMSVVADLERARLHWAIVGGESGPSARPCNVEWIRAIVEQCADAGVACFVKQLGANLRGYTEQCWRCGHGDWGVIDYPPGEHPGTWNCNVCGADSHRCRDRKGGDPAEWPADLRVREWPEVENNE